MPDQSNRAGSSAKGLPGEGEGTATSPSVPPSAETCFDMPRYCAGCASPGGVFIHDGMAEGITCQVCGRDYIHSGSGYPPIHAPLDDDLGEDW